MSYKQNLKCNLENLMKKHNVTNDVLAEKTGVSRSSINRIRMNKGNPTVETLLSLCDFFGVTIQAVTGNEAIPQQNSIEKPSAGYIKVDSTEVPLMNWGSLNSQLTSDFSPHFPLFALISPKEYMNIPKDSLLIIKSNAQLIHGDYILVADAQTNITNIAEYVQDISGEYVKSCLPEKTNSRESQLIPLDSYIIFGVLLESRKIFKPTE